MADFNKDAQGRQENSASESMKSLESHILSIMKDRYKKDPERAKAETQKFLKEMEKKGKDLSDLEWKSAKLRSAENIKNAKELGKLLIASGHSFKGAVKVAGASLKESISNLVSNVDKGIDQYAKTYSQYSSKINARLQNFDKYQGEAFHSLNALVKKNLAASPYIRQEEMLSNLDKLIEVGINYNLELRAFLSTVTDKIVTTFNALDETLLAMVRLQQLDTTQARMGMEAYLTRYLNSTYENTEYLNSLCDTVTSNLFEASSQLGRNASIELEYVVQKWLGSMYSVGVGQNFLNTISQGLGYLGSGNIDLLSSNAGLLNLLVMAANRSGVEYSGILSQGLNADTANRLLSGIASYVLEISLNNNQVVRSQYAQLFGMTLSDMTAMLNLSSKDLKSISQNMLSYGDTINELNNLLNNVGSRMHISEMIENVFDNFMTGVAGNLASNAGSYVTWKVASLVEDAVDGIAIPTVGAFGNFINLGASVAGLLKTGMVGASMLGQIGQILGGLSRGGSLSLDNWTGSESTSRGSGFGAITSGYSKTTSTSAFVGSSSGSDIYASSVTAAKDLAASEVKGKEDEEDVLDLTKAILEILESFGEGSKNMHTIIENSTPIKVSLDGWNGSWN